MQQHAVQCNTMHACLTSQCLLSMQCPIRCKPTQYTPFIVTQCIPINLHPHPGTNPSSPPKLLPNLPQYRPRRRPPRLLTPPGTRALVRLAVGGFPPARNRCRTIASPVDVDFSLRGDGINVGVRPPASPHVVDRCGVCGASELGGEFFVEGEQAGVGGCAWKVRSGGVAEAAAAGMFGAGLGGG